MKNPHIEKLRRQMREFHRHNQWRLEGGLYIPHAYPDADEDKLSWWDDVGFILNGRRVIVHWLHPRSVYGDAIEEAAFADTPEPSNSVREARGDKKTYRKLGRSRKKVAWVTYDPASDEMSNYFAAVEARRADLSREGIDLDIKPSMKVGWYKWATAVELVAPIDVRSTEQAKALAAIARRLLKHETTVENEWPGFSYGREHWLSEAGARSD